MKRSLTLVLSGLIIQRFSGDCLKVAGVIDYTLTIRFFYKPGVIFLFFENIQIKPKSALRRSTNSSFRL